MRTTLTLEPDVAVMLAEYRRRHALGLKEAVNEVLRRGLTAVMPQRSPGRPFKTEAIDHGRALVPNADDVAEILEHLREDLLR